MPSVARHLAVLGCIAFLFVTSASVTAQNGPPRQILPEGIRGGSETVPEPRVEIRTYTFAGGELPTIKKNWENAIDVRLQFGPVVAVWHAEFGKVNTFQHIWPYKSLDQREEIRKKSQATGLWPAGKKAEKEGGRDYNLIMQENKIVVPSSFSPLQ